MRGFALVILVAAAASASAQQLGQWSWDATVGAGRRTYESTLDGATVNELEDQNMRVTFGLNGFVVHPAIVAFRLGVDTTVNRYAQRAALDNGRVGYRADLRILPQSDHPLQLYAARERYDYAKRSDDPFLLQQTPEQASSLGGRLRVRRGLLGGLLLGADRTIVGFVERAVRSEKLSTSFADWSRSGKRLQHHYRVERQDRDYGAIGYTMADTILKSDQSTLVGKWRWTMATNATRREIAIRDMSTGAFTIGRVQNRLVSAERGRTLWDFGWDAGYAGGAEGRVQSHLVSARVVREHKDGYAVQWAPYVSYGVQLADRFTVTSPQAGISTSWAARRHGTDLGISAGASYLRLQSSGEGSASASESQVGYAVGFSAGHGTSTRWRKELELTTARNQFRVAGESIGDVPQFGTVTAGTGTEDSIRARLTLTHRWRTSSLQTYTDWSLRHSAGIFTTQPYSSASLTQSLQLSLPHLSMLVNGGDSVVETSTEQRVRHIAVSAAWRPFQFVSVNSLYRKDRRMTVFEPRIEGQRVEGGINVRLGEFYLNPQLFVATERLASGEERVNRGLTLSVSRQFGGWLPIVTAPQRRGVIR